jgi:hypothetical protein
MLYQSLAYSFIKLQTFKSYLRLLLPTVISHFLEIVESERRDVGLPAEAKRRLDSDKPTHKDMQIHHQFLKNTISMTKYVCTHMTEWHGGLRFSNKLSFSVSVFEGT